MYYFYLNFPNYKTNSIMIHHQDCGDCKSGHGKLGSLSNKNGFWLDHLTQLMILKTL